MLKVICCTEKCISLQLINPYPNEKKRRFFCFFQSTVLVSIGPPNSEGKNITPPNNEGYFDLLNGKVNCHSHGIRYENSKFIMFIRNTVCITWLIW